MAYHGLQSERNKQGNWELKLPLKEALDAFLCNGIMVRSNTHCFAACVLLALPCRMRHVHLCWSRDLTCDSRCRVARCSGMGLQKSHASMVRRGLQEWLELDADKPKDCQTAMLAYTGLQYERNKQDNQELKLPLKEALEALSRLRMVRSSAMCFLCMLCLTRLCD